MGLKKIIYLSTMICALSWSNTQLLAAPVAEYYSGSNFQHLFSEKQYNRLIEYTDEISRIVSSLESLTEEDIYAHPEYLESIKKKLFTIKKRYTDVIELCQKEGLDYFVITTETIEACLEKKRTQLKLSRSSI